MDEQREITMIMNRAITIAAIVGGALSLITAIISGSTILAVVASFLFLF